MDPAKVGHVAEKLQQLTMNASKDAIDLRSSAMFGKCVDVKSGNVPWTKGELLGEWECHNCRKGSGICSYD